MQTNQRGGIVSFIVVAVALAGLLGGALYFSKQQGREARDATPAPQISQQKDEKATDKKTTEEKPTEPQTAPAQNNAPATNQTQQTTPPARNETRSTPTPSGGTDRVASTGPSDQIPATGPAETVAVILALSGLTFGLYRHASSRRSLRRSALRR